ncbi:hypothetical protein J4414_01315 [Candidatus Woesearchaeota archaeon]|nr:hypothetical protein [Candidatus Woesearchaeota archaeon]
MVLKEIIILAIILVLLYVLFNLDKIKITKSFTAKNRLAVLISIILLLIIGPVIIAAILTLVSVFVTIILVIIFISIIMFLFYSFFSKNKFKRIKLI